jgi:hypothetical protein
MTCVKITFRLDGTGVSFAPGEPPTLDGLLAACLARFHVHGEPPTRDEIPFDIPLPLATWHIGGQWGYCASALELEGASAETMQYWRKRLRTDRIEMTSGSPNTTMGNYKDWNMPVPLLMVPAMVGYAVLAEGKSPTDLRRPLRRDIRFLGHKRAHGHGGVVAVEVDPCDEDYSLIRDGKAMRWLPDPDGIRLVRTRPPYWNRRGRVACCEIGDAYSL